MRKFLTGLGLAAMVAAQGISAAPAVAASSIELTTAQVLQPLVAAAAAKAAEPRAATAKVDNAVRQALDAGQRPDILVHFHGKADLRGANRLPAASRAAFVHRELSGFADGVQAPARSTLQGFGRQPSHLSDSSGYMVLWLTNSIAVSAASEAEIEALAATPGVAKIVEQQVIPPQPEIEAEAIPPFSLDAVEASIAQINAPDVWALGFQGQGITVGNVDSGVRHTHQALVNQYRGNTGSGFDHNYNWFDPYSFSTAPRNSGSHGTHTMGTMVGDDGGTNQVGVAPGAKWVACIGFGGAGGGATDAGLIACNQWMVAPTDLTGSNPNPALAAHVSNNSWGNTLCNGAYDTWYESAVDGLIAAGVVPVWSMGNASNCGLPNNPPLGQNSSPSNYGKVLSVGSTGNSNGTYAPHSIKGPTQNPSLGLPDYMDHFGFADLKPNVVAPGVSIRSTISSSDTAYGLSNGTSMSAPAVAGMIALMWNAAPCLIGDYATTGSLVMSTATPIPVATGSPSDGPGNVPNQATGWGEVNALAAVDAAIAHCAVVGGPDPVILVSPAQVNLTLFQGDEGDSSLIIRNVAGGTLEWSVAATATPGSCGSPVPVSWLSLAPASGSTGSGMTSEVAVSVDTGALEIGSHSATICVASNDSTGDTLIEVPVNLTVADPDVFPLPYCEVTVTNDIEPISRVVFAGIDNSSSPTVNGSPAHEDFRSVVGNVETDASYLMRVEGNTAGPYTTHVVAFFDWNRDGDFGDAGESRVIGTISSSTGTDGIFASANVTIPAHVTSGPVRMRVSKQYDSAPTPCGPISWGQAEDYTIQVTQVAPEIALAPASLLFDTTIGGSESQDLSISNLGTGALSWSIGTAEATRSPAPRVGGALAGAAEFGAGERVRQPFVVQPMADCAVVPGQIVHDDGSVENGYSGNPDVVTQLRLVDRFTPAIYPALVTSVCVSFISQGPTTLNYNVVLYDDDGSGGSPGTRLGSVAATATNIPVIAGLPTTPSFYTVDLSGLGLTVEDGSVYIGVEYAPVPGGANIFVSSDQSATNPVGYAGGYFYTDSDGAWGPIEASYPNYRALMVRAALPPANPEGCDIPANIPWLSVSPAAGTVAEGQATTTSVSVDASGMAPGVYDALLCVASNDRENPLIEYPVELRVRPTTLGANITVDPAAVTATLGDTQIVERSITIGNTGSATLDWEIGDDLLRAPDGIPLYVQDGNPGSGGVLSIEDLSGASYSTQAADDFVVPAGALWVVDRVVASGIYDGLVNPAAAVNVSFHADAGGMPGAVVANFEGLVPTDDVDGVLTIDLPQGVSLEEGSWWLSVQPAMDFFADGSWNWQTQSVSTGAEFHWQNPGGGYGGICTSWAPGTSCGVASDTDLTFALYGAGTDSGSCALPAWIAIDPASGSVSSGQTQSATVTLDSTGLADGIYSAAVCIDSNDAVNPRVVVPVNITVDNAISEPVIDVTPASLAFTVAGGDSDSGAVTIANIGSGALDWTVTTPGGVTGADPALDEVLAIPDFTFSGGETRTFTVPAGIATSGSVLEFTFKGTAAVTGFDWPSDTCLQVTSPEGAVYIVGGFIGTVMDGCGERDWANVGTSSGTYTSFEANAFPGGTPDEGVWTFMFVNDYSSSGPVAWSNVSITLHKSSTCAGESADWLNFNPASGSTYNGSPDQVDVSVDTTGLLAGQYEGLLCINSNDTAGQGTLTVPVELTVLGPSITVDPLEIVDALDIGESSNHVLTIGNVGAGVLEWTVDEAPFGLDGDPLRGHFPAQPWTGTPRSAGPHLIHAAVPDQVLLEKMRLERALRGQLVQGTGSVPAFATLGFTMTDYASLDASVPGALNSIVDPGPADVYAATFVNNDFSRQFFIATSGGNLAANAYGWIDTATGAVDLQGVLAGVPATNSWTGATWDPATGTVYAVNHGTASTLWTIDPLTGAAAQVGPITGPDVPSGDIIISIAANAAGQLFGLDISADTLVAIDKSDASAAAIGSLGVNANFAQDMAFDFTTDVLWWAGFSGTSGTDATSTMYTIDVGTGAATVVGAIQDRAEVLSFSIATAAGGCASPADVPWITLSGSGGTIPSGGADDQVTVTLDAALLGVGVHQASICVRSNDVEAPLVEVPVTLTVNTSQPYIDVTPESLSTVVGIGLEDTQTLTIANLGNLNDLTWNIAEDTGSGDCSVTGDVSWLSVSASAGATAAGGASEVDVTFIGDQPDGVYTSALCIGSNDPTQLMVVVPVTMEVDETIGTPEIEVAPAAFVFDVPLNGTDTEDLSITNAGTGALNWTIGAGLVEPILLSRDARPARNSANPADRSRASSAAPAEQRRREVTLFGGDPLQVLVLSPDTTPPQDMVDDLNGFPDIDADLFTGDVASVSVATLEPYDVVVTVNNNRWSDAGADINVGNALADYVDGGGKVVVFSYALDNVGWELAGRFITEGYAPLEMATADLETPVTMTILLPDHPIADGVVSLSTDGLRQAHVVRAGAELIAQWSDGSPLVAANDSVVAFNELYSPGSWTGDLDLLLHNAVVWLGSDVSGGCGGAGSVDWLTVAAPAGVALAGETDLSTISVDAGGMAPGTYEAQLCVASNDADTPVVNVPVTLNVTSANPFLTLSPTSLESELGSEATDVQQLAIGNLGEADLEWTIVEEPATVRGTTALLYDQTANEGTEIVLAIYDLEDEPDYVVQAADDFVVPSGSTWNVTRVFAAGQYNTGGGPLIDVNVFIYADAGGEPGTAVASFSGLSADVSPPAFLSIDLPTPVELPEGTYWLSVQPVMDFGVDGYWSWWTEDVQTGAGAQWRNPEDGWGTGCTSWSPITDCWNDEDPDLTFQIYGTVGAGTDICSAPADMPWVSVNPASGSTAQGETSLVDVTFTSVGMADGTYEGNLCLTSNADNAELVVIPLTLVVDETIGMPEIAVAPAALSFSVMAGGTDSDSLVIENTGTGRLDWTMGAQAADLAGIDPVARALAWSAIPVTGAFTQGQGGLQVRTGNLINVGDTQMSQTVNTSIAPSNSVSCDGGANSLWRRFYFDEHPGLENSAQISSVDVAIQEAAGTQTIQVNLYTIPSSVAVDTIPVGSLTAIGTASVQVNDGMDGSIINVPVSGVVTNGVDTDLVVEVAAQNPFYIGATDAGETHPGFITAPDCGITTPLAIRDIGADFVDTHIIMVVNADPNVPECAVGNDVPWLEIGTASGSVLGGQSDSSLISVDSDGLAPGVYEANLCVASNAANNALVEVPVVLTVNTEVTVSPGTVADGTVGTAYSVGFTATGPGTTPPFTFTVTDGALPDGLVLATDGNLSGTPIAAGSFSFTVTATDSSATGFSGSQAYSMDVAQGAQTIDFDALPPRTLDEGSFELEATATSGLAVAFSSLTPASCTVAGVEVTLVATGLCTIQASQAGDANWLPAPDVTRSFVIQPGADVEVEIGPDELPVGKVQEAYLATLTASGDGTTAPFTFAVTAGTLPMGLELSEDGELSGTPVEEGQFTFTVTATDSTAEPDGPYSGTREYTLVVQGEVVFSDGFEGDDPIVKLAGDGAEALSVPLLDLLANHKDRRLVTAAVLVSAEGERVGLVQARCASNACEVRVLHKGADGAWTQGDWWLVDDEPFQLQLFIEKSRVTDATRGRKD